MNDNGNTAAIANLRREIETAVNRRLATPKDFDVLREMIFSRLHILVSATTLKRIWGYIDDNVSTRRGTLDILARYVGYADFEAFENVENYIKYNCSYWNYAYLDKNGWHDASDRKNYEWITSFYEKYVLPLKDGDVVTIFECSI